ncbi:hypothetical protein GRI39_13410 [Altererythrobacter indicus]|uniref:Iron transporter n=1 Tax=Altericroceibacterium indicum TaxID=374177 RepID=A0A845AE02_9SPHN|nr:hypothetical protein [Altericroceibacterium indicum]MXP27025.1 hypothetical protein [Altericroceibacterium indicum]
MTTRDTPLWLRRTDMGLRILAAVPVSYAVASLWAMALARILPMERSEATITATLLAFAICCAAVMWSFAARSGWRALWSLVLIGAAGAAITWLSIKGGAA